MTKSEMTEARADVRCLIRDIKNLVRSVGDDMGCDGSGEELKALRGSLWFRLKDLAEAGDRKPLEARVWELTHKDYRGYRGAPCRENRTISLYIPGQGTCSVLLSEVPVNELLTRV